MVLRYVTINDIPKCICKSLNQFKIWQG